MELSVASVVVAGGSTNDAVRVSASGGTVGVMRGWGTGADHGGEG
jgi:hypothetical protein